jgi:hypothetical protein
MSMTFSFLSLIPVVVARTLKRIKCLLAHPLFFFLSRFQQTKPLHLFNAASIDDDISRFCVSVLGQLRKRSSRPSQKTIVKQ